MTTRRVDRSAVTDAEGRRVAVERRPSAGAPNAPAKSRRAPAMPQDASLSAALNEIAAQVRGLASRVRRLPKFQNQQLFIEADELEHQFVQLARRIEGLARDDGTV